MNFFRPASVPAGRGVCPSAQSVRRQIRSLLQLVQVRLRIPVVLLIAALIVGRWDVIRNYWDRLTRPAVSESSALRAVSSDTEYFCPMDPGVVSTWPGQCGVCNMALVRRKRGEAVMLPDGVIARMQLSPYRIQLAGIETEPVSFRPLSCEVESSGLVVRDRSKPTVVVQITARQAPWLVEGLSADVACADFPGREPLIGRVTTIANDTDQGWENFRVTIAFDEPPADLRSGMIAIVRVMIPVAAIEPFRAQPAEPPPLKQREVRKVYACSDHPDSIRLQPARCPVDEAELEIRPLAEHQRLRWWCSMHPSVTAEQSGEVCRECDGMALQPRVISYNPRGQVLAVPESAVMKTGQRTVVFAESMPGMFDGVEVVLGPRCGGFYPIVKGLEAGQKVAVAGAFLLDAETRLNPNLTAGYFGAARGRRAGSHEASVSRSQSRADQITPAIDGLSDNDRLLVQLQKICPVTRKPLGSMGKPARVKTGGGVVFLCCAGCESTFRREPAKYLASLPDAASP